MPIAEAHFIVPMQVDRSGYRANLRVIQWYEGFSNSDEQAEEDFDIAGITTGRVVFQFFFFDQAFEPIEIEDVELTLTLDDITLGPLKMEEFAESSFSTTQNIEDAGNWDAMVRVITPAESTPVNARFTDFLISDGDPESAAGSVIEEPTSRANGGSSWLIYIIGGLSILGIAGLIIFGMMNGRNHGKSQEEQTEESQ